MVATRWTLAVALAATAVSASTDELQFIARLLKRQEVGTPAYNCHDNCGQAIIQGRNSADVCNDEIFLTDYKACLQCSGPDNQNIWQYYGTTLTKDASPCGLSTTPLSGTQPDVGAAIPAGSSTSSTSQASSSATSTTTEASEASSSAAETPSATGSATSATSEATTTASASATVSATSAETSAQGATESSTGYATASATGSVSATGASSASSAAVTSFTPTGTGSVSGNGTATTSSGLVVVTNAANALSGSPVGFYGALALGALYAAAQ